MYCFHPKQKSMRRILHYTKFTVVLLLLSRGVTAQQVTTLSLQQAVDAALQNNHLLKVKKLQVEEKQAKIKEDAVKQYPTVNLHSLYSYNAKVGQLVIPQGSFGSLPLSPGTVISLPDATKTYDLGKHNLFVAGVSLYQPLTQQGKIHTGLKIDQTDVLIAQKEKDKAAEQVTQAIEKLYYGILINQQQQQEAAARLELAKIQLYDVESALLAGKTVTVNKTALLANKADEEQNLLKLDIEQQDYRADLGQLTGLPADSLQLQPADTILQPATPLEQYQASAAQNNNDILLAQLGKTKSELAIKAARQSYLPDIGITAGYTYQQSFSIYPANNVFAGLMLSWNLQDILSNKQVFRQRNFVLQQAEENALHTQLQVKTSLEKAYRKLSQSRALIRVAQEAVQYRREDVKIQQDKRVAGLNTPSDLLNAQAALAKSTADLLAAQLSYRLALSDLRVLSEGK